MYQTAGSEVLRMQVEECLGVPLYIGTIRGRSCNTSLVYQNTTATATTTSDDTNDIVKPNNKHDNNHHLDEVEDLHHLLSQILQSHPQINAVSSGAILSTYQRSRIENVCSRLHLTSLAYLWRRSCQSTVLDEILQDLEMDAVVVRVACPPGLHCGHLGRSLRSLRDEGVLDSLQKKYGMHVAGEGGEYETIVTDCQLFRLGRLVLDETEVVEDRESGDGVGILRIVKCRVEKKGGGVGEDDTSNVEIETSQSLEESDNASYVNLQGEITTRVHDALSNVQSLGNEPSVTPFITKQILQSMCATPNVRIMRGGLCHISALLSPTPASLLTPQSVESTNQEKNEAELAVQEFLSILQTLNQIFHRISQHKSSSSSSNKYIKPQHDILFVHLYLSQISHFASINAHYQQYFGMHLPPSRSCVGVGFNVLPGGRRVMMDCLWQLGSGEYLRVDDSECHEMSQFVRDAFKNKQVALRKTLHVQSISSWAPVCIGPYSQANILRSSLVFLAGMIGLVPQSMTLIQSSEAHVQDWEVQLYQSWRNAASVLDGLEDGGGKLEDCIGGLVYFSLGALKDAFTKTASSLHVGNTDRPKNPWHILYKKAQAVSSKAIADNGGIIMGSVDGVTVSSSGLDPNLYDEDGILYGGYEDEETWREMTGAAPSSSSAAVNDSDLPLLMVCVAELPMNAQAEVELVCASRRAAACLEVCNGVEVSFPVMASHNILLPETDMLWYTGYDHPASREDSSYKESYITINSVSRYVGKDCACISTVTADIDISSVDSMNKFDMENILSQMIDTAIRSATCNKDNESSSLFFNINNVLNVRLYYVAAAISNNIYNTECSIQIDSVDDGTTLRTLLHSVLASKSKQCCDLAALKGMTNSMRSTLLPTYTVVPVINMCLSSSWSSATVRDKQTVLAIQMTFVDAIRMETETWIRHGRE